MCFVTLHFIFYIYIHFWIYIYFTSSLFLIVLVILMLKPISVTWRNNDLALLLKVWTKI